MAAPRLANIVLRLVVALVVTVAVIVILRYVVGDKLLVVEAASVSVLLKLFGLHYLRVRDTIYVPARSDIVGFRIEWHCSGIVSLILYLVTMTLIPMKPGRRLVMLLVGIPVIYLVNIARIALVVLAARHVSLATAAMIHSIVGPILLLGTIALLVFIGLSEELGRR